MCADVCADSQVRPPCVPRALCSSVLHPSNTVVSFSSPAARHAVQCCTDGAGSYSDFDLFFLLKHSFHKEWLDTFEKLPTLIRVVIWADMLPGSQLVSLSGPFAFLHTQNIYSLTGLGHCLLKTSHFVFCRYRIIMDIKSVILMLGLKTQTVSRQR